MPKLIVLIMILEILQKTFPSPMHWEKWLAFAPIAENTFYLTFGHAVAPHVGRTTQILKALIKGLSQRDLKSSAYLWMLPRLRKMEKSDSGRSRRGMDASD